MVFVVFCWKRRDEMAAARLEDARKIAKVLSEGRV